MKTYKYILGLAIVALGLTACVQDLDVIPFDKNNVQTFEQDAVFAKVYATLGLTGQNGPDGNGDVDQFDEGATSFYRVMWECNEFPTDEGWWVWGDPGVADLRIMNWGSDNYLVGGLYYRFYIDITLCNHFLDRATGEDEITQQQRAEVRFIRALNYWYLLDMFGTNNDDLSGCVPFALEVSTKSPEPIKRADLFKWLETELKEVEGLLPEKRLSTWRVDKVAAQMLLARMYLNGNIYTRTDPDQASSGQTYWNEAADYAYKVINNSVGYKLNTTPSNGYSAYQALFMGDNSITSAADEALLMIYQDGQNTRSWGGTRFLVCSFRYKDLINEPCGTDDYWGCFRSSPELVSKFVDLTAAASIHETSAEMPGILGDDRAIFCSIYNDKADMCVINGSKSSEMGDCWGIMKWTGLRSDGVVGSDASYPDTDIPFMRVAEAYLTYAEAVYRGGAAQGMTAEAAISALRDRANNTTAFTLSEQFLLDEWSREFYCEGRRRTDLVRFDMFAGANASYQWEGRADKKSTDAIKEKGAHFNVFPLYTNDVTANPNLIQHPQY